MKDVGSVIAELWQTVARQVASFLGAQNTAAHLREWLERLFNFVGSLSPVKFVYLTVALTAAVSSLVAASLLLWKRRTSSHNRFWGLKKSVHQWHTFTKAAQPKYCSVCRQLISGFWIFRNTGLQCSVCNRHSHLSCLSSCEQQECKCPMEPHPLHHIFVEGNLPHDSVCCVCGIICSSAFGLYGLRCLWCNRTLHDRCVKRLPEVCDLGAFRWLIVPPTSVSLALPEASATTSRRRRAKEQLSHAMASMSHTSSKYVEKVGTQLKDSLGQVQEAMSVGLREGLKEVTAGMKRLNEVLRANFKIRRELLSASVAAPSAVADGAYAAGDQSTANLERLISTRHARSRGSVGDSPQRPRLSRRYAALVNGTPPEGSQLEDGVGAVSEEEEDDDDDDENDHGRYDRRSRTADEAAEGAPGRWLSFVRGTSREEMSEDGEEDAEVGHDGLGRQRGRARVMALNCDPELAAEPWEPRRRARTHNLDHHHHHHHKAPVVTTGSSLLKKVSGDRRKTKFGGLPTTSGKLTLQLPAMSEPRERFEVWMDGQMMLSGEEVSPAAVVSPIRATGRKSVTCVPWDGSSILLADGDERQSTLFAGVLGGTWSSNGIIRFDRHRNGSTTGSPDSIHVAAPPDSSNGVVVKEELLSSGPPKRRLSLPLPDPEQRRTTLASIAVPAAYSPPPRESEPSKATSGVSPVSTFSEFGTSGTRGRQRSLTSSYSRKLQTFPRAATAVLADTVNGSSGLTTATASAVTASATAASFRVMRWGDDVLSSKGETADDLSSLPSTIWRKGGGPAGGGVFKEISFLQLAEEKLTFPTPAAASEPPAGSSSSAARETIVAQDGLGSRASSHYRGAALPRLGGCADGSSGWDVRSLSTAADVEALGVSGETVGGSPLGGAEKKMNWKSDSLQRAGGGEVAAGGVGISSDATQGSSEGSHKSSLAQGRRASYMSSSRRKTTQAADSSAPAIVDSVNGENAKIVESSCTNPANPAGTPRGRTHSSFGRIERLARQPSRNTAAAREVPSRAGAQGSTGGRVWTGRLERGRPPAGSAVRTGALRKARSMSRLGGEGRPRQVPELRLRRGESAALEGSKSGGTDSRHRRLVARMRKLHAYLPFSAAEGAAEGAAGTAIESLAGVAEFQRDKVFELAKLLPAKANVWQLEISPAARVGTAASAQIVAPPKADLRNFPAHPDAMPLLVFVNVRSGGQTGTDLLRKLYSLLNPVQVIDIQAEQGPQRALAQFRPLAELNKLRIVVCGGDGTISWVINEMHSFYGTSTEVYAPVGALPLGTGNDLCRVLGWGVSFDGDVRAWLQQVQSAHPSVLDVWQYEVSDLSSGEVVKSGCLTNYLDVGIAARIALSFHRLREAHPEFFHSRFGNKVLFGEVGFMDYLSKESVDLKGTRVWCDGQEVRLPEHVEGIVVVNISSYAGGVCLWPDPEEEESPGEEEITTSTATTVATMFDSRLGGVAAIEDDNDPSGAPPVIDYRLRERRHRRAPSKGRSATNLSIEHRGMTGAINSGGSLPVRERREGQVHEGRNGAVRRDARAESAAPHVRRRRAPMENVIGGREAESSSPGEDDGGELFGLGSRRKRQRRQRLADRSGTDLGMTSRRGESLVEANRHRQQRSRVLQAASSRTSTPTSRDACGGSGERRRGARSRLQSRLAAGGSDLRMSGGSDGGRGEGRGSPWPPGSFVREGARWRKQSAKDQIIEVVAIRTLFHLGQIQVGLARPVRICQGREIVIEVPTRVPMQADGEPWEVQNFKLTVRHKCESIVLTPDKEKFSNSAKVFHRVLDAAVLEGFLQKQQRNYLLKELSKRLELA